MQFDDPHFLVDREDTTVTTDEKNEAEDCPALPPRTWVITKKLDETAIAITQEDINFGRGPAYTAGKFLCYRADDPSKKPAFMRIYAQLPMYGTEFSEPGTRSEQAVPTKSITELVALKRLKKMGCDVVPDLLGFQEETQGPHGFVPGGYITYVVWEKVPGEPLDYEEFWKMNDCMRDSIQRKFREAYSKLLRCGVELCMASMSKLILDASTGEMHISGFSQAAFVEPTEEWSVANFALFGLVKPPAKDERWLETKGWEW